MYLPLFVCLHESFWKGFESGQKRLTLLVIKCASLTWDETWVSYLRRARQAVACENIRFSSLFEARDVSRGGTSATQRQKFHTDDAIQCLHNKSSSHGVPNINLSNFTCLLVDFGKVLCLSANHLQQNSNASTSREGYIPQILTVLLETLRVYIWPVWPFVFCVSIVNNVTTPSTNQRFWPHSGQILHHQYGISVTELQTFLRAKRAQQRRARRNGCFHRLDKQTQFDTSNVNRLWSDSNPFQKDSRHRNTGKYILLLFLFYSVKIHLIILLANTAFRFPVLRSLYRTKISIKSWSSDLKTSVMKYKKIDF